MAKNPCSTRKASPLVKLISVLWGKSPLSICLLESGFASGRFYFFHFFLAIYEVNMGECEL